MDPTIEQEMLDTDAGERRVMSRETSEKLLTAMKGVVVHGTARSTKPVLQGLDGVMAGKTGTAQVSGRADNGWFAGQRMDLVTS